VARIRDSFTNHGLGALGLSQQPDALQEELQQFVAFVSSDWAEDGALLKQLFSQVVSLLQAWAQVTMPMHAESFAHVWLAEQQLDMTQLAHDAWVKLNPHADVPPEDPPELLPLPLLLPELPPELDPDEQPVLRIGSLAFWHAEEQLCPMQSSSVLSSDKHEELQLACCWQLVAAAADALYVPLGHAHPRKALHELSKLPSCEPQLLWMQEKHELPVTWLTHAPPLLPLLLQASAAVTPTAAAATTSIPPIVVFIFDLPESRSRTHRAKVYVTQKARIREERGEAGTMGAKRQA
jgi:hypothetical protein